MDNYYDKNAKLFFERTVSTDMSRIYERFIPYLPKGGRILDSGCGVGRDSKAFTELGFVVDAFDSSVEMVRLATQWTGLIVEQMRFDEMSATDKYDGVWACASLLHVQPTSLLKVFNLLLRSLKKRGVFYASFKYGTGELTRDGRFFCFQNEDTITSLIGELENASLLEMWQSIETKIAGQQIWLNFILRRL